MGQRSHQAHQEIDDLEHWMGTLSEHLGLLRALSARCITDDCSRRLDGRIAAAARRMEDLRSRRTALQRWIADEGIAKEEEVNSQHYTGSGSNEEPRRAYRRGDIRRNQ